MKMKLGLVGLAALLLAAAGPASAQQLNLADLPVSAKQNGRVLASTRTDTRGEFRFDLPPGAYDLCVQDAGLGGAGTGGGQETRTLVELLVVIAILDRQDTAGNSRRMATPASAPSRHRLSLAPAAPGPRNGGRAGGQALRDGGGGCIPYTVVLPNSSGSTRSEPVPITLPDGSIIYGHLDMMRTNDGPGDGSPAGRNSIGEPIRNGPWVDVPIEPPARAAAPGGPGGPVRNLPPLPAQAATGSGGVHVATGDVNGDGRADARTGPRRDSHIPPPAVAANRTVTVVGTLSQER